MFTSKFALEMFYAIASLFGVKPPKESKEILYWEQLHIALLPLFDTKNYGFVKTNGYLLYYNHVHDTYVLIDPQKDNWILSESKTEIYEKESTEPEQHPVEPSKRSVYYKAFLAELQRVGFPI